MTKELFEQMVAEIGLSPVPEPFRKKIRNVAFVIEDEPSEAIRMSEGIMEDEALLGLYQGIPQTARGEYYGVGMTLPDTITLYRLPIEAAGNGNLDRIREVIADTIWHEVAHHFGLDHAEIDSRTNSS
ncbi:MAG: metallopeptidase family protein [Candidatus Vogelbacteria bacterium]|nr:metallopeptidase family protein [Candidatus Vogelbacteria bacterium]